MSEHDKNTDVIAEDGWRPGSPGFDKTSKDDSVIAEEGWQPGSPGFPAKTEASGPSARYLIWSVEHRAWWRGNQHGYTTATHHAGLFTLEQANLIAINANRYSKRVEEIVVEAPSRELIELDLAHPDR